MPEPFAKTISVVEEGYPGSGTLESLYLHCSPARICCLATSSQRVFVGLEVWNIPGFMLKSSRDLTWLPKLLDESLLLKGVYQKKTISCFSSDFLLIPDALDAMDHEVLYKAFLDEEADIRVYTDLIKPLDAKLIYAPDPSLIEKFDAHLGPCNKLHTGTLLLNHFVDRKKHRDIDADMVIHIKPHYFDLMLFDQHNLNYYNTFYFEQPDDILYYIFYLLHLFGKEPSEMKLLLAGELNRDSGYFMSLSKYFNHTDMATPAKDVQFADCFDDVPVHHYYNLIYGHVCE